MTCTYKPRVKPFFLKSKPVALFLDSTYSLHIPLDSGDCSIMSHAPSSYTPQRRMYSLLNPSADKPVKARYNGIQSILNPKSSEDEEEELSDDQDEIVEAPLCGYKRTKCIMPCIWKKRGGYHSLCAQHRERQNSAQKKSDAKRRDLIRDRRKEKRKADKGAAELVNIAEYLPSS